MLITAIKRDLIIRISDLRGCHTTETLTHCNTKITLSEWNHNQVTWKEGRRLGPKSSPKLMNLVSVFCRRNSYTPQMLSKFYYQVFTIQESQKPWIQEFLIKPVWPRKPWLTTLGPALTLRHKWGSCDYCFTQSQQLRCENLLFSTNNSTKINWDILARFLIDCFKAKAKADITSNYTNTYQKRHSLKACLVGVQLQSCIY